MCGLRFGNTASVREHAGEKSELCLLNLLIRGPFLSPEQHRASLDDANTTRKENSVSGYSKHKSQRLCVRTFGPHFPVYDRHGEMVKTSKKGHPLGPSRALHLPAHLLEIDEFRVADGLCTASRYAECTERCMLCKGVRSEQPEIVHS